MNNKRCASFSFVDPPPLSGDMLYYESQLNRQGISPVAGVDEAGRGPLAGPVVAGCVVLHPDDSEYYLYKDSKTLTPAKREELFEILKLSGIPFGIGISSPGEIDTINILQASLLAMRRAVEDCVTNFSCKPQFLLIDGTFTIPMELPQQTLTKGESKSASIAAASIVAKVTRDHLMAEYHKKYPMYNLLQHKGYPTKAHREAIALHGPSPIHRKSFKGVREFCPEFDISCETRQPELW